MSELKPCPFCGGHALHYTIEYSEEGLRVSYELAHPYSRIVCQGCGLVFGDFNTEQEAIDAWNTRHVETCRNVDADPGWFSCSECGCICSVDWYGSGFGTPNFCPNCGRKVEEG